MKMKNYIVQKEKKERKRRGLSGFDLCGGKVSLGERCEKKGQMKSSYGTKQRLTESECRFRKILNLNGITTNQTEQQEDDFIWMKGLTFYSTE